MHLAIRSALVVSGFACSFAASAPAMAFESLDVGVPMCSEYNVGEHALVTEIINGHAVQIIVVCNGSEWVEAVYHLQPQVQNEGVNP